MPLKILIALAIVNQSHPREVLCLYTSLTWSCSCTMVDARGAEVAFRVFTSVNPAEIAAGIQTAVHMASAQE